MYDANCDANRAYPKLANRNTCAARHSDAVGSLPLIHRGTVPFLDAI
ncbi:Uncharacterised protein [Mycobacteroides abscessus subsp. abscessus]|nr:Uncharacterised protein [Mycobacteroides abscessus subsp. abscessus]SKT72760.1 Uncharacterised protein [Mycobacteroides abscessus subsp. abscessus]SKU72460.1 Uncharacterised protein [Mycobacteroides abscessus subsp. abscessus]